MKTAPDVVSIWIWNHAHQVSVELVDFLVFNCDGYRDPGGNQPDVQVIGHYTRMMSQSDVTLSVQRMVVGHGVCVAGQ